MKYPNIKTAYILIPFLLLVFSFCTKQVAGPKGDPGEPAKMGNVKQTQRSFTVYPASWSYVLGKYKADIYFPELTDNVLTQGEVKVYMKVGTKWFSLPYGVGDIFMQQTTDVGYLHLEYMKIHGGPPPSPGQTDFRVVIFTP